jgi:hypothetical protein
MSADSGEDGHGCSVPLQVDDLAIFNDDFMPRLILGQGLMQILRKSR